MQYRPFGRTGWQVSALGFGAMRLPVVEDYERIDEQEATAMLHCAIDNGLNYVDTAYPYHAGQSESFLGRSLQGGYRQRIKLATKMPSWLVTTYEDFDRYFDQQLQRLQTQSIDFYLIHGLDEGEWARLSSLNVLDWAEKTMADRRIDGFGFSFHDQYAVFQQIVDAYDQWTLCQVQYNYMDEEYQAGTKGLRYAAEKGIAVVVMEPIRGGQLARKPPPVIVGLWNRARRKRTPAEWALHWVWNHPEVSVVLSGMSTLEQVRQNISSANQSSPGILTDEELALIAQVRDQYRKLAVIPCTKCRYCLPCPSGVNIPRILEIYNEVVMYNEKESAGVLYSWLSEREKATSCTRCCQCENLCPQEINITTWLARAHELLSKGWNAGALQVA